MPVLSSSAYNTAEDVATRIRTILNDSEVTGGDIITSAPGNTAPFTFDLINAGYERVQIELASVGVEVARTTWWLIGLPTISTIDPEARLIVDDTGANIIYPNGVGNVFANTPQLPTNLILPVRLWERQSGTANPLSREPMHQALAGLSSDPQQTFLMDWEWISDGIQFRGATQIQDVKIWGEKSLPKVSSGTDPVPIRGVVNAAAYQSAKIFADGRGGTISPEAKASAAEEIFLLKQINARRRQHKPHRRKPYSGRGGRQGYPFI